jgi:hypothetical protein
MFEKIPKAIFGLKQKEIGDWKKHGNNQLHCIFRPPNLLRAIKYRRLRVENNRKTSEYLQKII